jgi:hypothetical protein
MAAIQQSPTTDELCTCGRANRELLLRGCMLCLHERVTDFWRAYDADPPRRPRRRAAGVQAQAGSRRGAMNGG